MSGTPRDLSAKSAGEIAQMRLNAERVLADPKRAAQHKAARAMLEGLPAPAARARGRAAGTVATASEQAVAQLTQLAGEVAAAYDTSPPDGTRHPHKLSDNGKPKVGGRQRNRQAARDRYISHRRGDEVAAIGWLLRSDEDPVTGGCWYIPDDANWYTEAAGSTASASYHPPAEFDTARAAFLSRLEAIGTPKR
jgi:hypothetical protein